MRPEAGDDGRVRRFLVGLGAQGLASIGNVSVALVVAQALGPGELGRFGALFALLTFFTALQTHWVGDSITVWWWQVDRARDGAVQLTQLLHMAAGGALALLSALWPLGLPLETAFAFALLVCTWQLKEFGRRVLIARRAYGLQAINEALYLSGAGLALSMAWSRGLTLTTVFLSMAFGAAVASIHALPKVPHDLRRRPTRRALRSLARVASYGGWRAAQGAAGALGQVVVRGVVIAQLGYVSAGLLEAARLVVAPLFVALAAVSNVLLPDVVLDTAAGAGKRARHRSVADVLLAAGVFTYVLVLMVFGEPLTRLLAGDEFDVPRTLVLAWAALAAVTAYATGSNVAALVLLRSRLLFGLRFVGTLMGVSLAWAFAALDAISLVPLGLAAGALFAKGLIDRALPGPDETSDL